MAAPDRYMDMTVSWTSEHEHRRAVLDSGGELIVPFDAVFVDDELRLELTLDVIDGLPSCVRYSVQALDGRGLEHRTTEIARGLNIRKLMSNALTRAVWETTDQVTRQATSIELIEAVVGSVRRRRAPITDKRLREVAKAYRKYWMPGGAEEFAAALHVSERQMYRLIKLARQRGFLKEGE